MDTTVCKVCKEAVCRRCRRHLLGPGEERRRKIEEGHPRGYRNIRFCFCGSMTNPVKIIILIEDGVVENVYVPGDIDARYIVIDRDAQLSDELHSTGPQPAGSHAELEQYDHEAFRIAFDGEDDEKE